MTTLYKKKEQGSNWTYIGMEEATLSDLKAALEVHGMVAMPIEITDNIRDAGNEVILERCKTNRAYKAMIKAAQDEE